MSHNGDVHSAGPRLWSCPVVPQYSRETQEILTLMMKESNLSNFQKRQITCQLKNGGTLPLTCCPTSSAPAVHPKSNIVIPASLPAKQQKRSAAICKSGDNYVRERFRPAATRDLEQEKRRLQDIFAMGQEEKPRANHSNGILTDRDAETETDRFQEVLDEIEDRKQFLKEMTALGRGKYYQNMIDTEISQKIRELEVIDRARGLEWRSLMEKQKKTEGSLTAPES